MDVLILWFVTIPKDSYRRWHKICGLQVSPFYLKCHKPMSSLCFSLIFIIILDSVCASNIKGIISVLARANAQEVNTTVGPRDLRTPLHLACAMGNLAVAQLLIWVSQIKSGIFRVLTKYISNKQKSCF